MHLHSHAPTLRTALALLLPALGLAAGEPVRAQTTPTVYVACYVPLTGTVYRIKTPDTKPACGSTSHVEFSWTDGVGAIRSGDAAGGDLSGLFPDPTVARLLGRALAITPPAAGQVLTFDGSEWVPSTPSGGGDGATDHGALTGLGDDDHSQYLLTDGVRNTINGFAVVGTSNTGSLPASGASVRLMWYPVKRAFRAGQVVGTQWDDANVGLWSNAMGLDVTASGINSTALGLNTTASGERSTAMGRNSTASGDHSTAMGAGTAASGDQSTAMGAGTSAGGTNSTAMGNSTNASGQLSTAMGSLTTASGQFSTAMGRFNTASGTNSTAMGAGTSASGANSTAMGSNASTNGHLGAFVYGDASTTTNLASPGPHSFTVRAAGGTTFYSNTSLSAGVTLAPGAGAWTTVSDVNRKHLFREESGEDALEKIAAMPIRSWSYRSQAAGIRHLGPTAQDFHAAFGLGESELGITTTDIDGVSLLAVQALEKRTRELQAENTALRNELDDLRARLERLERDRGRR